MEWIKYLPQFLPAESLLLMEGKDSTVSELARLTFMDLVLKKVLEVEKITRTRGNRERTFLYVSEGKNFASYPSQKHEKLISDIFRVNPDTQVQLRNFVRMVAENISSSGSYHYKISRNPNLDEYFSNDSFLRLTPTFKHTAEGKSAGTAIRAELDELESIFPELVRNDPEQVLQLLLKIGGNVFLLKNINLAAFGALAVEFTQFNPDPEPVYDPWMRLEDLYYMSEFFENFESSDSGSWSTDFDSGCSGGSGCGGSGCSGCGGCGGGD